MELEVLVHLVDVGEDVLDNAGYNTLHHGVAQYSLKQAHRHKMGVKRKYRKSHKYI